MCRTRFSALLTSSLIACVLFSGGHAEAVEPDDIEGLQAWWTADSLSLNNADKIETWADRTGNKHDLTYASGVAPDYYENWINGEPVVYVREGTMSVANPFQLNDHTIFLVYRADGAPSKGLFHGGTDSHGILLQDGAERRDVYHGANTVTAYNTSSPEAKEFRISVLGRRSANFRAWLNGKDVSSGGELADSIGVNTFFLLKQTTFSRRSGNGLAIAEMIFFDRYLSSADRVEVVDYLSAKYQISVEEETVVEEGTTGGAAGTAVATGAEVELEARPGAIAQLSTSSDINVNDSLVVIPWDTQDLLDEPFLHDTETDSSKLSCRRECRRVRLYVSLPVTTSVAGANVRVFFRLNGATFLRGEGRSGPFGSAGAPQKASVSAEVLIGLSKGDYIEVVTMRSGAPGEVVIDPGAAVFIAEEK